MKGKKKQLLGFFGLALVMAMTAIAYSLPAPEAAAQDLNISVTVKPEAGSARFLSPAPGAILTGRTTTLSVSHNKIRTMSLSMTCKDKEDKQVFEETWTPDVAGTDGVVNQEVTVPKELGDVTCMAKVASQGLDGEPYDDTVNFTFRSANIPGPGSEDDPNKPSDDPNNPSEDFDDKNNPIVNVVVGDDVEQMSVQVFDSNNNPVFVNEKGEPTPILTKKDAFKDGKVTITLPMADYKAKPGKYVAIFTATNSEGKVVSVNEYWFEYVPKVETPGTGSIFKDMNLSRADYLVTGLVAFGAVAGFAMYLIFRRSRR